ncbi:MAG: hypothetical protein K0S33_2418 [Bacteroidetes bacterium]|jgi:hypothetical protein|nr:hypothetical protein [Bacteroidota bacterium]
MKKILLTFGIALALVSANAQDTKAKAVVTPPSNNATPVSTADIKFEKLVHDYGTIKQGANGDCEFIYTNTGKEPLIISNCQGSCGCTVPSCPKEPILPGKTGVIKVHYDTKRVGMISKSVTVNSNAKSGTLTLQIKGNVEAVPVEEPFPTQQNKSGAPFEK